MLELNIHIDGIDDVMAALSPRQLNTIATRTLNRSARVAKTEGSRAIREEHNIKAKDIDRSVTIIPARKGDKVILIVMIVKGGRFPLKYFGARQTRRGVTAKIKKSEGRKLYPGTFIGGHVPRRHGRGWRMVYVGIRLGGHVFKRLTRHRLPIKKQVTDISIPMEFQRHWGRIKKKVIEFFTAEIHRLIKLVWEKKIHI